MKKLILLVVVFGTLSCGSTRKNNSASIDKFVIENLNGKTAEEIKRIYPDANIKEDIGMFEEGTEERPYSILYPDSPDELHITWTDNGRTKINDIRITDAGNWKSNTGIIVGTTYDELNSLNEKPVSFYGFGWDYSGAVVWNDGKFEKTPLRVFLAPGNSPENKFYGDHLIEATPEEITALNLKVNTVIIQN